MFTILSWNIQQGGGTRTLRITKALEKNNATVIVLSEYKNNANGQKIRQRLLQAEYRYQFVTPSLSQENSVLIVSKLPCSSQLHSSSDENYPHNILEVKFSAFNIIGVYLPHKKHHALIPYLTNLISSSETPYIIAGDFNTGKNYIDQKGSSFWYTDELIKMEDAGYIDAYRHVYQDAKEYSWFSHQGNGYRYDHTYIHHSLAPIVKDCFYLHLWREEKLSDHSPMLLKLG